jgi:hypothetical protein
MDAREHRRGAPHGCECAAVAAHLMTVFRSLPAGVVEAVVVQAAQELRGQVAPGAHPELMHRLAQCRLGEMSRCRPSTTAVDRASESLARMRR